MKIDWIQISSRKYGGVVYGQKVKEILAQHFDLEIKNIEAKYFNWKYLKPLEWLFNSQRIKNQNGLRIVDDSCSVIPLRLDKSQGKNLVIVFHLDFSQLAKILQPVFLLLERIFYHNLNKADAILTISQYWQNHFLERGYSNVHKIYCGFNIPDFKISEQETSEFKKKFNLEKKPIIYIGNCQKAKGVVDSYRVLRDLDATLVTSGEQLVKIPALNLNLEYRDYLRLLAASSVVVTMSRFKEGWCMTAHEAMLLKRPVIGSGLGGMRELLKGGNQIICQDFSSLKKRVEYLLTHPEAREKMGKTGYNFAKNFTSEKFREDWLNLIKKLCAE